MKRLLAIILSAMLIITALPIATLTAFAADVYSVSATNGNTSAEDTVYATLQEAVTAAISAKANTVKLDENCVCYRKIGFCCEQDWILLAAKSNLAPKLLSL